MRTLLLLFAALLVAGCGEKSLSDSAIEKALKEAAEHFSLQKRNGLFYQVNKTEPYTGWAKNTYDSGQARFLYQIKDGKEDGPYFYWYENGQRRAEEIRKDGKKLSVKYWNSKGQEVENWEKANDEQEVNDEIKMLREELEALRLPEPSRNEYTVVGEVSQIDSRDSGTGVVVLIGSDAGTEAVYVIVPEEVATINLERDVTYTFKIRMDKEGTSIATAVMPGPGR